MDSKMRAQQAVPQAQPPPGPKRYDGQNGNPPYDTNQGGHYGKLLDSLAMVIDHRVRLRRWLVIARALLCIPRLTFQLI